MRLAPMLIPIILLSACNRLTVRECQESVDNSGNHLNAVWTNRYCTDVLPLILQNAALSKSRTVQIPKECESYMDQALKELGMDVNKVKQPGYERKDRPTRKL